ncbi:hypothetical protein [Winogradskyella bathintestinalis]|uniref:Uncharacterized protein n=1 Tax=Winogradskyella bathintestinalis TaxID=3035208 RepID=A0ABT7ZS87_9FLAO|nr:hypothetical protein [Winogradskyella bathintestinalis]MDN3491603.1 hypothetical protein [Winogradskyella bathintestinalis]
MKLTEPQIKQLYTFTREHYVEHYDLQTELVDHLANDIESQWQVEPQLLFEDAKNRAFKKFGIFGFMDAIEQKGKAMNKRYMRYFWTELKKWFELPQFVATITLFLVFYFAFSSRFVSVLVFTFFLIIAIWSIFKGIKLKKQFNHRKKISNKKWMLEELIFKQAGGAAMIFISQIGNIFIMSDRYLDNIYAIIGFSVAFTAVVLINYISLELIPNKAEKLLKETYPEFSL